MNEMIESPVNEKNNDTENNVSKDESNIEKVDAKDEDIKNGDAKNENEELDEIQKGSVTENQQNITTDKNDEKNMEQLYEERKKLKSSLESVSKELEVSKMTLEKSIDQIIQNQKFIMDNSNHLLEIIYKSYKDFSTLLEKLVNEINNIETSHDVNKKKTEEKVESKNAWSSGPPTSLLSGGKKVELWVDQLSDLSDISDEENENKDKNVDRAASKSENKDERDKMNPPFINNSKIGTETCHNYHCIGSCKLGENNRCTFSHKEICLYGVDCTNHACKNKRYHPHELCMHEQRNKPCIMHSIVKRRKNIAPNRCAQCHDMSFIHLCSMSQVNDPEHPDACFGIPKGGNRYCLSHLKVLERRDNQKELEEN